MRRDAEDVAVIIPWGGREVELLTVQMRAVAAAAERAANSIGRCEVILSCNGTDALPVAAALLEDLDLLSTIVRLVDSSATPGPAHARNAGVEETAAPLLLFCDADDEVREDWICEMAAALRAADIVRGRLDPSRNRHGVAPPPGNAAVPQPIYGHLGYGPMSNLGVRRAAFVGVGGVDEELTIGEDVDFCWRAQYAGYTFAIAPAACVYVRWRPTLRGHFHQGFSWGRGDVELLERHRAFGAQPTSPLRFAAQLAKLPLSLTAGFFHGSRRWTSVHRAGKILGRAAESLRRRTWSV